jgi:hypothetical protein
VRRRRLLLCLVALACLGLAAGWVALLVTSRPGVTPENYERIQEGMTRPEVEALLGGSGVKSWIDKEMGEIYALDDTSLLWVERDLIIIVSFDHQGRVCRKSRSSRGPGSFFDRLRPLLPW